MPGNNLQLCRVRSLSTLQSRMNHWHPGAGLAQRAPHRTGAQPPRFAGRRGRHASPAAAAATPGAPAPGARPRPRPLPTVRDLEADLTPRKNSVELDLTDGRGTGGGVVADRTFGFRKRALHAGAGVPEDMVGTSEDIQDILRDPDEAWTSHRRRQPWMRSKPTPARSERTDGS